MKRSSPQSVFHKKNNTFFHIILILAIYLGLQYFGGKAGKIILYPIVLLVTFLHEFGHALGAILTGGTVLALQVSEDGSGFTKTMGGSRAIILTGGYIGSAILGNLLFYIGVKKPQAAKITLYILASTMLVSSVFWFNSFFTTGMLIVFALALYFLANKTVFASEALMFLGLASIIYIVQDFNVGPSSDLQAYAELFVIIPATVWMYIWLTIVLVLCFFNFRMILKNR